jgi:uncharacterized membrane protein
MEEAMHLIGLFIIALVIAAAAWFINDKKRGSADNGPPRIESGSSHLEAINLLNDRYARGEISHEQYLAKKRDIEK